MKPWERHQVRLEFTEVHIKLAVETKRCGHRRYYLSDNDVELGVRRTVHIELLLADGVDGLVIQHNRHLSVIEQPMRGKHGVVGLHNARRNVWGGVNLEADLALLAVINRNPLKNQGAQAGPGATANSVIHDEALDVFRVVHQLPQTVVHLVEDLFSDSVVSAGE